jgi:hypothetical protein
MPNHPIIVSQDLRSKGGKEWVYDFKDSSALLSAILSVVHPELYQAARLALIRLSDQADLQTTLATWASVFSGVQLIANRSTPIHRDSNSGSEWYDTLATIGPYTGGRMTLQNIGVELDYPSGTVVNIGGKVIQHGVEPVSGERVCFAYFMRTNVHQKMKVKNPGWITVEHINEQFL